MGLQINNEIRLVPYDTCQICSRTINHPIAQVQPMTAESFLLREDTSRFFPLAITLMQFLVDTLLFFSLRTASDQEPIKTCKIP
jgi:hypothetical protein